ncbi:MAG: hypothetical protein WD598_17020 [Acidimicrobiia bacterium]
MSTAPITAVAVETEILRLNGVLDQATEDVARLGEARAHAKMDALLAHARAVATSAGRSSDVREAEALVASEPLQRRYEVADASLRAMKEAAHNCRAQLDALRSVNANVRHMSSGPGF